MLAVWRLVQLLQAAPGLRAATCARAAPETVADYHEGDFLFLRFFTNCVVRMMHLALNVMNFD